MLTILTTVIKAMPSSLHASLQCIQHARHWRLHFRPHKWVFKLHFVIDVFSSTAKIINEFALILPHDAIQNGRRLITLEW